MVDGLQSPLTFAVSPKTMPQSLVLLGLVLSLTLHVAAPIGSGRALNLGRSHPLVLRHTNGQVDIFRTLEVAPDASKSQLKRAFRGFSKIYHPDHNAETEELYKEITHAFDQMMRLPRTLSVGWQEGADAVDMTSSGPYAPTIGTPAAYGCVSMPTADRMSKSRAKTTAAWSSSSADLRAAAVPSPSEYRYQRYDSPDWYSKYDTKSIAQQPQPAPRPQSIAFNIALVFSLTPVVMMLLAQSPFAYLRTHISHPLETFLPSLAASIASFASSLGSLVHRIPAARLSAFGAAILVSTSLGIHLRARELASCIFETVVRYLRTTVAAAAMPVRQVGSTLEAGAGMFAATTRRAIFAARSREIKLGLIAGLFVLAFAPLVPASVWQAVSVWQAWLLRVLR